MITKVVEANIALYYNLCTFLRVGQNLIKSNWAKHCSVSICVRIFYTKINRSFKLFSWNEIFNVPAWRARLHPGGRNVSFLRYLSGISDEYTPKRKLLSYSHGQGLGQLADLASHWLFTLVQPIRRQFARWLNFFTMSLQLKSFHPRTYLSLDNIHNII